MSYKNGLSLSLILALFSSSISFALERNVLTLQDCIHRALQSNLQIRIIKKQLAEAMGRKQEAFGQFLPQLSAYASYNRLSEIPSFDIPVMVLKPDGGVGSLVRFYGYETAPYTMGEEENYLARVSLTQNLFTWGKIYRAHKHASLYYQITAEELRRTENEVVFEVKKLFYSVLLARKFLDIANKSVEVMERQYQVTQGFFKEGKVSLLDVSRVKVLLVNTQTKRIRAANQLTLARKALANIINLPEGEGWEIQGKLSFIPRQEDLEDSISQALARRPEMKQIALQKKMAHNALILARAANKPNLSFLADYQYQKPYYFDNEWKDNWSLGFSLSFPFFTGFSIQGKVRRASARLEGVEIARDQLEKNIRLEVEKIFLEREEAKERIQAQQVNVKSARKNLEAVEERYEKGLVSDIELRDTQLALTQAETEYSQALYDYNMAQAQLEKAIGK